VDVAGDDGSQRILELVRQDEAVLVQRWVDMAVEPLQGRLTPLNSRLHSASCCRH
jgi:hypothetical protein